MILKGDEVTPDAVRQQQRLLPGRRVELVRLDTSGRGNATSIGSRNCSSLAACCATVSSERQRVMLTTLLRQATTAWHGVKLWRPDWSSIRIVLALSADLRVRGSECT